MNVSTDFASRLVSALLPGVSLEEEPTVTKGVLRDAARVLKEELVSGGSKETIKGLLEDPETVADLKKIALRAKRLAEKRRRVLEGKTHQAKPTLEIPRIETVVAPTQAVVPVETVAQAPAEPVQEVSVVDPEEIERQFIERTEHIPAVVFLPLDAKYRLENARAFRQGTDLVLQRLQKERTLLAQIGEHELAKTVWSHRDWVLECSKEVTRYIRLLGENPTTQVPRRAIEQVRSMVATDEQFAALFKTFVTEAHHKVASRYDGLSKADRTLAKKRESDIRTWCLEQLAEDHQFSGKAAERSVDQAIMAEPASRFVFDSGDILVQGRRAILAQVLKAK